VVQDVFLNLLEMETFPPDFDKNPKAYLQKSAFNRAINVLKARDCRKLADIHAEMDYVGLWRTRSTWAPTTRRCAVFAAPWPSSSRKRWRC